MRTKHDDARRLTWHQALEKFLPRSFDEMIAAGRYDGVSRWMGPWLEKALLPIDPARFSAADVKLHHYGKRMSPRDLKVRLADQRRRLCPFEALLAFGCFWPEDQRKFPVIGRSYDGLTPYLTGDEHGRQLYLGLHTPKGGYRETCHFLSVPL